jgi:glutamate-1-semialdehyde aminotransferase
MKTPTEAVETTFRLARGVTKEEFITATQMSMPS